MPLKDTSRGGSKKIVNLTGAHFISEFEEAVDNRHSVDEQLRSRLPATLASTSNVGLQRPLRAATPIEAIVGYEDDEDFAFFDDNESDPDYLLTPPKKKKRNGTFDSIFIDY